MKILALLTDAYGGFGGIAVYNRDLLEAMCAHPRVDNVLALPRKVTRSLEAMPAHLDYRTKASSSSFAFLRAVAVDALIGERPALIYCAHINLASVAVALRLRWRVPVLLGLYGIECWEPTGRGTTNTAVRTIDRFYSISQITRTRFSAWSDVPENRIDLLPNAIHLGSYGIATPSENICRRFGLAERTVILTLGRIVSQERAKGFDEVLEVLPEIRQRVPNILYVIAGDGDYRPALEAKAKKLGLADYVVFTGYVSDTEKTNLYRAAHAYVMPSRGEGFGFVFLEAMACGTPCVASSADGSRDAVRDGSLGAVIDPDNHEALRAAILDAIAKPRRIPDGLEYFAFPAFQSRVHAIIDDMVAVNSAAA